MMVLKRELRALYQYIKGRMEIVKRLMLMLTLGARSEKEVGTFTG